MAKYVHEFWPHELNPKPEESVLQTLVNGLTVDSRKAQVGYVFLALPGALTDVRNYIQQAIKSGVCMVISELESVDSDSMNLPVPFIQVKNLRFWVGFLAAGFYGFPGEKIHCAGVTGTNGKTTVCYQVALLLNNMGIRTGMGGTLGIGYLDDLVKTSLTTPDAVVLQHYLARMVEDECKWFMQEVSSQGLSEHRVEAIPFQIAAFTNLSKDHLDYHGDLEFYWQAKKQLFVQPNLRVAVINIDDPRGYELAESLDKTEVSVIRCGFVQNSDVRMTEIEKCSAGFYTKLSIWTARKRVFIPVLGCFNLSNAMLVVGIMHAVGINHEDIFAAIETLLMPSGRMQILKVGQFTAVIDFAHTPDALQKTLEALREHLLEDSDSKLVCVFGCGGDRDKNKRSMMGDIASRLADKVILTEDNSRTEDRDLILEDIKQGCRGTAMVIPDRRQAIASALMSGEAGDVVLIAGKGHETNQEFKEESGYFSDIDEVNSHIKKIEFVHA